MLEVLLITSISVNKTPKSLVQPSLISSGQGEEDLFAQVLNFPETLENYRVISVQP